MDTQAKRPTKEAWHRPLKGDRVEILCRAPGYHLRVTARTNEAWQAVELFEGWTGLEVHSDQRPARVTPPMRGQISMLDLLPTDELESDNGSN